MAHEAINLENTKWVKVKHPTDDAKFALFTGATKVFLQDSDKGAVVQGIDSAGVASIFRFRDVKADDLRIEAQLADPTLPAGVYLESAATTGATTR